MKYKIEATIDYADANGQISRRRIKISSITEALGRTYLNGYCMERKAPRQFRLDRIDCFITNDGECIEPDRFLAEIISELPKKQASLISQSSNSAPENPKQKTQKRGWSGRRVINIAFGTYIALLALFCLAAQTIADAAMVFGALLIPAAALWGVGILITSSRSEQDR